MNAAARASGVRPGMALAHAQALMPGLLVRRHDPAAQARRLELLGALAYGISSHVVLAPPDAVLLEIGASRALFGDWKAIEGLLRARLGELGHRATLAAAPTPAAARVLADLADGYAVARPEHLDRVLARVPVGSARLGAGLTEELRRVGVRTLGEAFALPRAALARRFGAGLLQACDRLRGIESESCLRYRPPDRFERRLDFDYGIAQRDALRFPLQRLARELAAFLQARDGGVPRFVLRFKHDPHERAAIAADAAAEPATSRASACAQPRSVEATVLEVGLRKPCRDAGALLEAAVQALERIALPAPAHALTLLAEDLPPFAPELRDLFDPGLRGQLDWDGLAERLRARLGAGSVRELALYADHRPERAWRIAEPGVAAAKGDEARLRPAGGRSRAEERPAGPDDEARSRPASGRSRAEERPAGPAPGANRGCLPPRPLWLLPRPVPFRGRIVRFVEPPERIETGWWDGEDMRRDYAIADLDTGQRAWLFRIAGAQPPTLDAVLPALPSREEAQGWMLHGWFA